MIVVMVAVYQYRAQEMVYSASFKSYGRDNALKGPGHLTIRLVYSHLILIQPLLR